MGEWNISLAKTGCRLPQAVMTTHVLPYKSKRDLEANLLNQKRQAKNFSEAAKVKKW